MKIPDISPNSFPRLRDRSVAAFAPSNPDIAYVFTSFRFRVNEDSLVENNWFHKFTLSQKRSGNRSLNLPNIDRFGRLVTQGSYNMTLAVKPDDENFVVIGGTSLFRSRDGFATANNTVKEETELEPPPPFSALQCRERPQPGVEQRRSEGDEQQDREATTVERALRQQ